MLSLLPGPCVSQFTCTAYTCTPDCVHVGGSKGVAMWENMKEVLLAVRDDRTIQLPINTNSQLKTDSTIMESSIAPTDKSESGALEPFPWLRDQCWETKSLLKIHCIVSALPNHQPEPSSILDLILSVLCWRAAFFESHDVVLLEMLQCLWL